MGFGGVRARGTCHPDVLSRHGVSQSGLSQRLRTTSEKAPAFFLHSTLDANILLSNQDARRNDRHSFTRRKISFSAGCVRARRSVQFLFCCQVSARQASTLRHARSGSSAPAAVRNAPQVRRPSGLSSRLLPAARRWTRALRGQGAVSAGAARDAIPGARARRWTRAAGGR